MTGGCQKPRSQADTRSTSGRIRLSTQKKISALRLAILFAWSRRADDPPHVISKDRSAYNQVFDVRAREIDCRMIRR